MSKNVLIVGAGLFGLTCANRLRNQDVNITIIDKRDHVGGNCFSRMQMGIDVHLYGSHTFHTSNLGIVSWIQQFGAFHQFQPKVKTAAEDKIYSVPINLETFQQFFQIKTPDEAKKLIGHFNRKYPTYKDAENAEEWCLYNMGSLLYYDLMKPVLTKHWGVTPDQLPVSIVKRLPIRTMFNDQYYHDDTVFIGVPTRTWGELLENMIPERAAVILSQEYDRSMNDYYDVIIYSGEIDEYFNYKYGKLRYRTIGFSSECYDSTDLLGCHIMFYNHGSLYRRTEYRHFKPTDSEYTIVKAETSLERTHKRQIPMYPLPIESEMEKYKKYREEADIIEARNIFIGGRLGSYKYIDMDQTIVDAIALVHKIAGVTQIG